MRQFPIDSALAARLRQRRLALNWSMNQLALATGLSEVMVSRYETLRAGIPHPALAAIEKALADAEHKKGPAKRRDR